MEQFLILLAWIFGIGSLFLFLVRIIGFATYTEMDRFMDLREGVRSEFPMLWPAVVSAICWAWIISQ